MGVELDVVLWSATEIDETCRNVISLNHGSPCIGEPQHLFADILDVLPTPVLRKLQVAQKQALRTLNVEKAKAPNALHRTKIMMEATQSFLSRAENILDGAAGLDRLTCEAYCYFHDDACKICPPETIDGCPVLWLDVSGLVCVPRSTQGLQ